MKVLLFDKETDREHYTQVGMTYDMLIANALRPIFDRAKKEGVSLRDLRSVMYDAVNETILSMLIGWDEPSPPVEPLTEPISIIESGLVGELLRAPSKVDGCYPVDPYDRIEKSDDIANELERYS